MSTIINNNCIDVRYNGCETSCSNLWLDGKNLKISKIEWVTSGAKLKGYSYAEKLSYYVTISLYYKIHTCICARVVF